MMANDEPITSFQGEYRWLSNFHTTHIQYDGRWYRSVEHAYQAGKTFDLEIRQKIMEGSAGEAKRIGRNIPLRADWEQEKLHIMSVLLHRKFEISDLRALLLETKDAHIIEGNTWRDKFWGAIWDLEKETWDGMNHLGIMLMNIRTELNEK